MGSIVLTTLSVFLGIFFIFMGSIKLTQQINKEMHREIRRQFVQYAKVVPFATALGFKVSAKYYRLVVGSLEVIAGLILAFIPGRVKLLANVILAFIAIGGILTHYMIGDKFERIAPSIVFSLMLFCRLIVSFQVQRREALKKSVTISEESKKQN